MIGTQLLNHPLTLQNQQQFVRARHTVNTVNWEQYQLQSLEGVETIVGKGDKSAEIRKHGAHSPKYLWISLLGKFSSLFPTSTAHNLKGKTRHRSSQGANFLVYYLFFYSQLEGSYIAYGPWFLREYWVRDDQFKERSLDSVKIGCLWYLHFSSAFWLRDDYY